MGHVRDLPASAAEIPGSYKDQPWARLGINDHFEPIYIVPAKKKKVVSELRAALKDADELYIATDEDREGESIGWHLVEVLNPKIPVRRMVFSRDHRSCDSQGAGRNPCDRSAFGRRAGDAARFGPVGGLHALAAAVEKDRAQTLGRAGTECRGAADGAARTRTHRLRASELLGFEGEARETDAHLRRRDDAPGRRQTGFRPRFRR